MAQGLDLTGIHVLRKVPGSQQWALAKTQPALRLCSQDEVVYIQHGKVFSAGGLPIADKDLPGLFSVELGKCNPVVLKECGWDKPVEAVRRGEKARPAAKPTEASKEPKDE